MMFCERSVLFVSLYPVLQSLFPAIISLGRREAILSAENSGNSSGGRQGRELTALIPTL